MRTAWLILRSAGEEIPHLRFSLSTLTVRFRFYAAGANGLTMRALMSSADNN